MHQTTVSIPRGAYLDVFQELTVQPPEQKIFSPDRSVCMPSLPLLAQSRRPCCSDNIKRILRLHRFTY